MGSIHQRKDTNPPRWFVKFKGYKIYRDGYGQFMYAKKQAERRLHEIQTDYERSQRGECAFRIERYTGKGFTDVIEYFEEWLKTKENKKPATIKGYKSYFKTWIKPFFEKYPVMLHDIQLDTLHQMLEFIKLSGKGKYNVMNCFHTFLDFAWRSRRIPEVPPFPKKEDYNIIQPKIEWIDSATWWKAVDLMPMHHRPIFLWMYYHLMREAEACALRWEDWDEVNQNFIVRRSISARQEVNSTKTGKVYVTPCHSDFLPFMKELIRNRSDSPYIFVNPLARNNGQRYSNESIKTAWKNVCSQLDISIRPYAAIRHSRATQMSVELGMTAYEIHEAGTWKRIDSVYKYRDLQLDRKKSLLERKGPEKVPNYLKVVKND